MSVCLCPIRAQRDSDGNVIFGGSAAVHEFRLPCGQCINCRKTYAEQWGVRMTHEAQLHPENAFITLTYSDEHLPMHGSLDYRHTTLFLKRLRKALSITPYKDKIKYYLAGEYGDQLGRPHYHAIIFGFDFSYALRYKGVENRREHKYTKNGHDYFTSSFLDSLWGYGAADIGEVNYETCRYTASYVTKKITGKQAPSHYGPKEPERAFMSRKEAIGKRWLTEFWSDIYPHDHAVVSARKLKVPRYYDRWLEKTNPLLFEQIKLSREQSMIDSTVDTQALARIYEFEVLKQAHYSNELTGDAPVNLQDRQRLEYLKNQSEHFHFQQKDKRHA